MKNKLTDLNNHLFMQLERLSDEDLTPEQLEREIARSSAIVDVSDQLIANAALQVKAAQLIAEHGGRISHHLPETATRPRQIEGRELANGPGAPALSNGQKPN